ncbi:hypothetical protein RvY_18155 [Ramazzottius varieornatus]|uniref:Uncharacterized protein n=1 Tax=Ramazzottius varieornatus TaxID=947166 RepID=A0A1D1W4Q3_RAMVA|nr:hypothetical protein RvY_18155 [Ramazzottius varieornatus]
MSSAWGNIIAITAKGGARLQEVLERMDEMKVHKMGTKCLALHCGTNDLDQLVTGNQTRQERKEKMDQLLAATKSFWSLRKGRYGQLLLIEYPKRSYDTRRYPGSQDWWDMLVEHYNSGLKELAKATHIYFVPLQEFRKEAYQTRTHLRCEPPSRSGGRKDARKGEPLFVLAHAVQDAFKNHVLRAGTTKLNEKNPQRRPCTGSFEVATDAGCTLRTAGASLGSQGYAVGRGFTHCSSLKSAVSTAILKYMESGFMDNIRTKWLTGLSCQMDDSFSSMNQPRALGLEDFAGVFLLLSVGGAVCFPILLLDHLDYQCLPRLRMLPKTRLWHSRHIIFSQKFYRFINPVNLVSSSSSAKEFASSVKQGQVCNREPH